MTDFGRTRRRGRRIVLSCFLVALLTAFVATHIPIERVPKTGVSDQSLHTITYFVLGSLFLLTLGAYGAVPARRVTVVLVASMLYAAFDEITQPLVRRFADAGDWLANIIGIAAAVLVCETLTFLIARASRARRAA